MGSVIAGWILFIIGCVMYFISIWKRAKNLLAPKVLQEELAIEDIKEAVDAITKLVDAFSKFSEEVQFLILGSGCIMAGLYLLSNKPF